MPRDSSDREVIIDALRESPEMATVEADVLGDEVIERHSEPHRCYHTVDHVREVLRSVEEVGVAATDLVAVRLAALYHDVVYLPLAPDNEHRSAEFARDRLTAAGVAAPTVDEVVRLIELTSVHSVSAHDANGATLMDADLGILAASPERYDEYRGQVRQEYAAVDDHTYAEGRIRVLEGFVSRPAIFHTSPGRVRRESLARENLDRELVALRNTAD